MAYGCWANAASAATAAGEHERALEFLDRGVAALAGHGLQSLDIHLLAARSFVLRSLGQLQEARAAASSERKLAEQLGKGELQAMASHDLGLVALAAGEYEHAADLLADSLVEGAPISRPVTRLALAEALARCGQGERVRGKKRFGRGASAHCPPTHDREPGDFSRWWRPGSLAGFLWMQRACGAGAAGTSEVGARPG